jgi:hypothetical protein
MVSPQALAKVQRISAEAESISAKLAAIPPAQRVTVVRRMLLDHCLELRAIIEGGTTDAGGVPLADILRNTQRLLLNFRKLRENERSTLH